MKWLFLENFGNFVELNNFLVGTEQNHKTKHMQRMHTSYAGFDMIICGLRAKHGCLGMWGYDKTDRIYSTIRHNNYIIKPFVMNNKTLWLVILDLSFFIAVIL